MTSDLKKIHRDLLEEFISLYENQPCLWRIKSKCYHDKAKRGAAYDLLLEKYKQIDPAADRDTVVKKINTFRTNYRREKKKIEVSRKSGAGTEDVYKPTLWYFQLFHFLENQETPRSSSSNLEQIEDELEGESHETRVEDFSKSSIPPNKKSNKKSNYNTDSLLHTIENHFKIPKTKEDRDDIFGKNVTMKMRDIANNTQKLIAEKLINDVLFMAEMGKLTISHTISNRVATSFPTSIPPVIGNNPHFSQSQDQYRHVNCFEAVDSDNSHHSVSSYVVNFSDSS